VAGCSLLGISTAPSGGGRDGWGTVPDRSAGEGTSVTACPLIEDEVRNDHSWSPRMSSATRSLKGLSRSNSSSGGTSRSGSPLPTSHGVASTAVRQAASSGSVSAASPTGYGLDPVEGRNRSATRVLRAGPSSTPSVPPSGAAAPPSGACGRPTASAEGPPGRAEAVGKDTSGRLRSLRERSVAGIPQLVGQSLTRPRSLPIRAGRQLNRLTRRGRDPGAMRAIPGAGEPVDRPAPPATRARPPPPASVGQAGAGQGRPRAPRPPNGATSSPPRRGAEPARPSNARLSLGRPSAGRTSSSRPSRSCASGPGRPTSRVAPRWPRTSSSRPCTITVRGTGVAVITAGTGRRRGFRSCPGAR
jgi:hypothetical protein